ncbi:MAG: ABC transporter permease [Proteobacteria bacterium]|nr:ABC transporter permease [Pseudomonadota bacterium]
MNLDRLVAFAKAASLPVAIVIVWALVTETGWVAAYVLPPPRTVVATLIDFFFGGSSQAYSGKFMAHFVESLYRVAGGFACGAILGIPLGIVLGYNRRIGAFIEPTIELSRSIPGICWLPLALVWFGIGTGTSVFLIALGSFYSIFLSTLGGVRYVNPVLLRAGRSLGATESSLLTTVILPAAFPSILSGLRLGLSYSWIYMVLGEFTGVNYGLGALLLQSRDTMDTPLIIGLMAVIGGLGVISDRLMLLFMTRILGMDVR